MAADKIKCCEIAAERKIKYDRQRKGIAAGKSKIKGYNHVYH